LINEKDVITMKVPYPNMQSSLAVTNHMYICRNSAHPHYEFIKCQRFKPYMLVRDIMVHYLDEDSDLTRNPFRALTRIDCDKLFVTNSVSYSDCMKAERRPDVCSELYDDVLTELMTDGYEEITVDESGLVTINNGNITFLHPVN